MAPPLEAVQVVSLADIMYSIDGSVPSTLSSAVPGYARVVIDSRQVGPGDLFVALPGEHVDGHQFVGEALRRGALGALVRAEWARTHGLSLDLPIIRSAQDLADLDPAHPVLIAVTDPLVTVQEVAAAHRRRFAIPVIGITGSVGKTTTKEVIAAVLRQGLRTLWSSRSWNNEIGVPLTLLQLQAEHQAAVIEMGTYGLGEITLLCRWAQPTVAIVTNVGVSHLERMQTADVVAQAKSELPQALPAAGVAILNGDDPRVRAMARITPARVVLYGLDPSNDVWAGDIRGHGLDGVSFTVHMRDQQRAMTVPLIGRHIVYAVLAAIAVARELGIDWDAIEAGLSDPRLQQRLVAVPGVNGSILLDDTYNAAPASCKAALELLRELPGRRLAAFGPMAELGPLEEAGHREVGQAAADVVDALVVVDHKARLIGVAAHEAKPDLPIHYTQDNAEAADCLRSMLRPGDYLLVKGARVARTEEIVQALAARK